MRKEFISDLIYEEDSQKVKDFLVKCDDEEELYVFAFNYNWEDGFEIPHIIMDNPSSSLAVALLLFYRAGGYTYLNEKPTSSELKEWYNFVHELYDRILKGKYRVGKVAFKVDLTRVQLFKLRKFITEDEKVFIEEVNGADCNITL